MRFGSRRAFWRRRRRAASSTRRFHEALKPWFVACAEAFMSRSRHVDVVVRGGGTDTGMAALLTGQIDLALSSREPTRAEVERGLHATGGGIEAWPVAREPNAARTLYVVAARQPRGAAAELLRHCRGAETRPLLEAAGLVPVAADASVTPHR
jgi:hypothetical protein